jgi:hypothetical protein
MSTLIRSIGLFFIFILFMFLAIGIFILKTTSYASETSTLKTSSPAPLPSQPSPSSIPTPAVVIIAPANNSVVPEGDITVSVRVTNFNGTSRLNGFIFYFMDVEPPTTPFAPATTTPDTYVPTTETSCTWSNVPPGTHTFSVLLVNRDFTPLMPPTTAKITLKVVAPIRTSEPVTTPQSTLIREPSTASGQTPVKTVATMPASKLAEPATEKKVPLLVMWISMGLVVVLSSAILLIYNLRKKGH